MESANFTTMELVDAPCSYEDVFRAMESSNNTIPKLSFLVHKMAALPLK